MLFDLFRTNDTDEVVALKLRISDLLAQLIA